MFVDVSNSRFGQLQSSKKFGKKLQKSPQALSTILSILVLFTILCLFLSCAFQLSIMTLLTQHATNVPLLLTEK